MFNYLDKMDAIMKRPKPTRVLADKAADVKYAGLKKIVPNFIHSSRRHRSQWYRPEYDFRHLQIAQHSEGLILRTIKKKADRVMLSGFEFVGQDEDAVQYVKNRIKQMELVSSKPFSLLIRETAEDLLRQANCMWVKVRSLESSSGEVRKDLAGRELDPVAGYYIAPFHELEFKTKVSGDLKMVRQVTSEGQEKTWSPWDVIHFYTDKKAGFTVGTPDLLPALDDFALLRRIEENVEELIETNLFPSYHYKIGTDEMPERYNQSGKTESELIKEKIEYMPAGSIYVSDHRHSIESIGAEGKALTIDNYLSYFQKRAIASAGGTEVDLGLDGGANRSTANALSKSMTMDVESLQKSLEIFINFYVINELLLEGGYEPFTPEHEVKIRFGVIDREERIALENQQIQMLTNKVMSLDEVRETLGMKPVKDNEEWLDNTYYKLFEEPLALLKVSGSPGSAAAETLAKTPSSNITPEAVNKEKTTALKLTKAGKATTGSGKGRKPNGSSSGSRKASAARSRPSNQSGTRSAPKLSRDANLNIGNQVVTISIDKEIDDATLEKWAFLIEQRYNLVKDCGVSLETVINNVIHRLINA